MLKIFYDKTFLKFVAVGVFNTLLGYATIMLFYHFVGLKYSTSYLLSYIIGFIISFFLNKHFVFESKKNRYKEFLKFLTAFGVSYYISYLALKFIVEHNLIPTDIAFFAGMVVYSTLFYLLNRFITFK
jgi:putative flippase GtrA